MGFHLSNGGKGQKKKGKWDTSLEARRAAVWGLSGCPHSAAQPLASLGSGVEGREKGKRKRAALWASERQMR